MQFWTTNAAIKENLNCVLDLAMMPLEEMHMKNVNLAGSLWSKLSLSSSPCLSSDYLMPY